MDLPLIRLAEVDSTQAFLRRNPHLGHCGVLADHQRSGQGRQGNRWESPAGAGLWLSVALPTGTGIPPGVILQRAMVVAARVLDPAGGVLGIKWPNDLVAWKGDRLVKLGGILGEQGAGRMLLGLGVNLHSAPEIPGRTIPPACLAEFGLEGLDPVGLAWSIMCLWSEMPVDLQPVFQWPEPGAAVAWEDGEGTCLGWEPDGRLKVATATGIRRLSAGDLSRLT